MRKERTGGPLIDRLFWGFLAWADDMLKVRFDLSFYCDWALCNLLANYELGK